VFPPRGLSHDPIGLIAAIGGIMGAVFVVGGLVIAFAAVNLARGGATYSCYIGGKPGVSRHRLGLRLHRELYEALTDFRMLPAELFPK
jgi:hypothetical protein